MAIPWGPIISTVGGLVGSLFGKSGETSNRVDYKQMVRDAQKAGFNPLTVLRNGGAAGYMQTSHPVLSSGAVIGEAMGHVGNFLTNFDPMADDRREQEAQLVDAQIRNLNASTASMFPPRPGGFHMPHTYEGRPSGTAGTLSRGTGQGENGEILPLYVDWLDPRTGKVVQLVNADAPDLDQMAVPVLGGAENEAFKSMNSGRKSSVWTEYQLPNFGEWWRDWSARDYERESRRIRAYEANRR